MARCIWQAEIQRCENTEKTTSSVLWILLLFPLLFSGLTIEAAQEQLAMASKHFKILQVISVSFALVQLISALGGWPPLLHPSWEGPP